MKTDSSWKTVNKIFVSQHLRNKIEVRLLIFKVWMKVCYGSRLCDNTARNDYVVMYPGFSQEYIPKRSLI